MSSDKPAGIGLSVAFIWALAAQMLTSICLVLRFGLQGFSTTHALTGLDVLLAVGYLLAMVILIVIGEALRTGRRWSWWLMLVLTAGLTFGGLVIIPMTIYALTQGDAWALWSQVILLTLPPFILYRLLQPVTREWYKHISPAAARARHGSVSWLATIIVFALIGGALTAIFQRLG